MEYIFHIGRNKNLSVAELLSVLGRDALLAEFGEYVLVRSNLKIDQGFLNTLGSVIGIFEVKDTNLDQYFEEVAATAEKKVIFTLFSNCLHTKDTFPILKKVKINLKNLGVSVRFIESPSTAAILGAGFYEGGVHVVGLFEFGAKKYFAKMIAIQDINAYSYRDFEKPYRDAKMGMLPPKLAQIMLNLAGGVTVYDPFCGTGTVLMEAILAGTKVKGSDLQQVNIDGTLKNLTWLNKEFNLSLKDEYELFLADAMKLCSKELENVDSIVTEGYLGAPKRGKEYDRELKAELLEIGMLYLNFLIAVAKSNPKKGLTVVLTLPVYQGSDENFFVENLVEKLPKFGYSVSALLPDGTLGLKLKESILYKREDQKVYRQIVRFIYTPL